MMDVAASPPQVGRMRKDGVTRHSEAHMLSALIVDDNFALRGAIARSLARDGWDVATATDGLEALEAVRSRLFDAVITDVHMPRRGGLWFWEQALALRPELRGKFVFMSSEPLPEPPSDAVFMVKPLSLTTLKSELQAIVRIVEGAKVPARELIQNPAPGAPVPPILPTQDGFLFLDKAKFAAAFAADVDAPLAEFMAQSQVPWGLNAPNGEVTEASWRTKPSWYLVATDDRMIPPAAQRFMSKRAGSTVRESPGSHAIYVSRPAPVVALIEQAAGALTKASQGP